MWALLILALQAQHPGSENVKSGAEYYRLRCAHCHGDRGEGARGPNLADGIFYHGDNDEDLLATIRSGVRGTEMPGFSSSEERLREVVAFIRALNQAAEPAEIPGDASRGEALFRDKGDCLSCHRVGREGSFAGPDLSSVGSRRSVAHLRTSVLEPSDDVRSRYWTATATTADGTEYDGFVLNEDRHTIQLLSFTGRLVSIDKTTLASLEKRRNSIMQSYDGTFTDEELDDLVAYMVSLRRGSKQ
jgi:putative heme-binding domain-containing protein